MIDQTPEERAVEDAINGAIQAVNPGAIVTGWVVVAETTVPGDPDSTAFAHNAAEGQGVAHTLGLLDIATRYHHRRIGDAG